MAVGIRGRSSPPFPRSRFVFLSFFSFVDLEARKSAPFVLDKQRAKRIGIPGRSFFDLIARDP